MLGASYPKGDHCRGRLLTERGTARGRHGTLRCGCGEAFLLCSACGDFFDDARRFRCVVLIVLDGTDRASQARCYLCLREYHFLASSFASIRLTFAASTADTGRLM